MATTLNKPFPVVENNYTNQSNLHIWCNLYQITNGVSHRARTTTTTTKNHNVYGNTKYPEEPKQSWERREGADNIRLPDFRLYYKL